MSGTLFVVATPIGHLGDLSERTGETLRRVPLVAAEDTRQTRKLLSHLGSSARLISLHAHSGPGRLAEVVERLIAGDDVAYCSDAGTPGVSDPGPELVAMARERGVPVIPIPGPSAVQTALSVTGWAADQYLFLGFAPRRGAERDDWLNRIRDSTVSVVCFEAPGRAASLVRDLADRCGSERVAMIGREMTKRHEEYRVGTLETLATELAAGEVRGEVTLVVAGGPVRAVVPERSAAVELAAALRRAGIEPSRVAKVLADRFEMSRNESYRLAIEEEGQ